LQNLADMMRDRRRRGSVLNWEKVAKIRQLHSEGWRYARLAKRFGVQDAKGGNLLACFFFLNEFIVPKHAHADALAIDLLPRTYSGFL
jgi:hypothetical protein